MNRTFLTNNIDVLRKIRINFILKIYMHDTQILVYICLTYLSLSICKKHL
jgi:hypothetical protein